MQRLLIAALVAVSMSGPALAGEIYGELRADGRPVGPGEPVRVTCPGNVVKDAKTDRFGSYRIAIPGAGRCVLSFREATFEVAIAADAPARYNFDFTGDAGKAVLRRK